MCIGLAGRDASAGGAREKALLDQERLDHILERATLLGDRGGDAVDPDWATVELVDDGAQHLAVQGIKALRVDFEQIERGVCDGLIDASLCLHLRVVAYAPQQ